MAEDNESSASQGSGALPHYEQSPKMICGQTACNGPEASTVEKLKAMDIDRRWECDNRIPTWNFGVVNFGFSQNFIHKGNIINDTDEFTLNIYSDVEGENGPVRDVTATRKIRFNGSWFNIKE